MVAFIAPASQPAIGWPVVTNSCDVFFLSFLLDLSVEIYDVDDLSIGFCTLNRRARERAKTTTNEKRGKILTIHIVLHDFSVQPIYIRHTASKTSLETSLA